LVAGILVADDALTATEGGFINRLFERLGFDPSERGKTFPIVDGDEAAEALASLPADARDEALALLMEAAMADGVVVDKERRHLVKVAASLGLDEAQVDERLAALTDG
jgi:uncharacterized tellurite resistance protein B-like protein